MSLPLLLLLLVQAPPRPKPSEPLKKALDASLADAIKACEKEKWTADRVAVALVDLGDPKAPVMASHRGEAAYYPASVVKMAFMAAAYQWAKDGRLDIDDALLKDLRAMIGPISNVATQRVVDRLMPATQGTDWLDDAAYAEFAEKRGAVNRWLRGLGLKATNACQKTWDELPASGPEVQFLRHGKRDGPMSNRNSMTADETALLLAWIATDAVVDAASCAKMRELMARDLKTTPADRRRALGGAPEGSKVWAKAGWVNTSWHEAALVELPGGRRFVQVVFTNAPVANYSGPVIAEFTKALASRLK